MLAVSHEQDPLLSSVGLVPAMEVRSTQGRQMAAYWIVIEYRDGNCEGTTSIWVEASSEEEAEQKALDQLAGRIPWDEVWVAVVIS